jgi:hypothetical protein
MPIRTLTNRFRIPLAIVFAMLTAPMTTRAASPRADEATGVWTARANAPGWNGRFTLTLELQQMGDSVHGVARFQYDNAEFQTPVDVSGTNTNNKVELIDRKDMFKLMGTLRGRHLDGRIAHGSHDWKNAVGVGFERADGTPNELF